MILLIVPPFYRFLGSHNNNMHLGLSYVASLMSDGVKIYNADAGKSFAQQNELFENSRAYQLQVEDINHPVYREVEDVIKEFKPTAVGITVSSPTYIASLQIQRWVNRLGIQVFAGGPHVTICPEGSGFNYRVPGLFGDITKMFPQRDCYINNNIDKSYIITGTGCCNRCSFCASYKLWHRVSLRPVEHIIEELKTMQRDIYFVDDTFTLNSDRAKHICMRMIEEKLDKRWRCDTRLDKLDKELLKLMIKAGCVRIKVGVESGSDRILSLMHKGINRKIIDKNIKLIKDVGIPFTVYLMVGHPEETDEDVEATIEFAKWAEADYYSLSTATPYPGTELNNTWEGDWRYLHHQTKGLVMNNKISAPILKDFREVNKYAAGVRE